MKKPKNFNDYINDFPESTQKRLKQMRSIIRKAAPGAEETISYGMPAFNMHNTYLVYFGGYKNHIGLYPAPVGVEAFKEDLDQYKTGKGSIRFPLNEPLPSSLISRIVEFQIKSNVERMKSKSLKTNSK